MDNLGFDISFLDMKLLLGISVLLVSWVQYTKEYLPVWAVKIYSIASGIGISFLAFCVSGCKWTVVHLIIYGIASASLSGLYYEILKDTTLKLRSSKELKNGAH